MEDGTGRGFQTLEFRQEAYESIRSLCPRFGDQASSPARFADAV